MNSIGTCWLGFQNEELPSSSLGVWGWDQGGEGILVCVCVCGSSAELLLSRLFPRREHDEHAAACHRDPTAPAAGPALRPGQCSAGPDPPDWRGRAGPSSMYPSTSLCQWVGWRGGCGRDQEGPRPVLPVSLGHMDSLGGGASAMLK